MLWNTRALQSLYMGKPLKLQRYRWSQLHVQHSPSSDANLDLKDFVLAIPADVVLGTMVISLY
jgi:hypothetical protein